MEKKNPVNLRRIKGLRVENDLTQSQVADSLGITRESYSKKENGICEFKPSELVDLAKKLEIEVSELFF